MSQLTTAQRPKAAKLGGHAAFIAVVSLTLGCGEAGPVTYAVRGVVRLDGEPLAEVAVVFTPENTSGEAAMQSTALTDASGQYELLYKLPTKHSNTPVKGKGALPGPHLVTVTDYKMMAEHLPRPGRVPLRYTDASTTPLRFDVSEDPQEIEIALTR